MEETKKTTVPPGSGTPASAGSPGTGFGGAGAEAAASQRKKRGPSLGTEKDQASGKGRVKRNASDLKFEAIRVLSNLPEDGRFFLVTESQDGKKETVSCWN